MDPLVKNNALPGGSSIKSVRTLKTWLCWRRTGRTRQENVRDEEVETGEHQKVEVFPPVTSCIPS